MSSFVTTEPFGEPLTDSRAQRTAILSWTDARGPHEVTLTAPMTLGAADSCNVVVDDRTVSRVHVELSPTDAGLEVRDLASTNGTWCDAFRVTHAVAPADFRLRLGRIEIRVRQPAETVPAPLWTRPHFGRLLGRSPVMRGLFDLLARVAPSPETVIIHGETGTGKELVAEAIHEFSPRRDGPWQVVDCSALAANLLEPHLFGHRRGAFTGADHAHIGAFEAANGGTIFLDEVGELTPEMQRKLLRVLEARTIQRVGENEYRPVDVRVISASWRDLREMVNRREFREDLYFRLAVLPVRVPALRDRTEDIPLLVDHFLERRPNTPRPTRDEMEDLTTRAWVGNVRELKHVAAAAAVLGWREALDGRDDPGRGSRAPADAATDEAASAGERVEPATTMADESWATGGEYSDARDRWIETGERIYIRWLLEKTGGSIMMAAVKAGIDNSYLRKRMKKLGM